MSHLRALLCSAAAALALAILGPFVLGAAPAFADGPHMSASMAHPQHMAPPPHMQMRRMHMDGDHDRDDRRMQMKHVRMDRDHDRDDRHMQMKHMRPDRDHDRDDHFRPKPMHPSHPSIHRMPHSPGHSSMMGRHYP